MPPRHFAARPRPGPGPGTGASSSAGGPGEATGEQRKSAFERAREAEEERRRAEEAETKAVYEDFVKSFERDDGVGFVGQRQGGHGFRGGASGFVPPGQLKRRHGPPQDEVGARTRTRSRQNPAKRWQTGGRAEFKRPESRAARLQAELADKQDNAPSEEELSTRRIVLGGLPPMTTASRVRELLAEYGEIVSVTFAAADPRQRGVAATVVLSTAAAAARARAELDQKYLGEGFWLAAGLTSDTGTRPRTGLPFNAAPRSAAPTVNPHLRSYKNAPPPSSLRDGAMTGAAGALAPDQLVVKVQYPDTLRMLRLIHFMVEKVVRHGPAFEAAVMERERRNPDFAFLFDPCLAEHVYYRWKAWSVARGEAVDRWPTRPAALFADGIVWLPPAPPPTIDDELDRLEQMDLDDGPGDDQGSLPWLGTLAHLHLSLLLEHISMRRGAIARVMAFAMDNSHAADEIVDVICESVADPAATVQQRIARLWAVGDILHNSGLGIGGVSKGTWKYRGLFQTKLVRVFELLHTVYRSFEGRIRAENFRRQVMAVISVWEGWNVFVQDDVNKMVSLFVHGTARPPAEPEPEVEPEPEPEPGARPRPASRWKKVERAEEPEPEPTRPEDLVDPALDGEPLTDSEPEPEPEPADEPRPEPRPEPVSEPV
ncbi:uncharacterized protein V1510DRAFT_185471 [Dipodascopsis tothii]|uniref:uncharacterized protein n=1 Tax=Dipodascopsis tothii TaxID=44089 RepID=UPI0034CD31C9